MVLGKIGEKMFVVGLTGGIGSGKSQASDWFAKQGIDIIDADILAREVVAKGSHTLKKIADKFGDWVLDEQGELNRKALRDYVFTRPDALIDLEQITHPAIRELAKERLAQSTSSYVILVAPLLLEGLEAGLANLCDRILVIDATEETQIQRASLRDGQTIEKIRHIMANQFSREERLAKAHDIVDNNGTVAELYAQIVTLHEDYLMMAKYAKNI